MKRTENIDPESGKTEIIWTDAAGDVVARAFDGKHYGKVLVKVTRRVFADKSFEETLAQAQGDGLLDGVEPKSLAFFRELMEGATNKGYTVLLNRFKAAVVDLYKAANLKTII